MRYNHRMAMKVLELFGGRVRIEYGEGVEVTSGGQCRKVRYGHRGTAEEACRAMKRKRGSELEVYPCRDGCGGWHIGHAR